MGLSSWLVRWKRTQEARKVSNIYIAIITRMLRLTTADSDAIMNYESVPEEVDATPRWEIKQRAKAFKCSNHATAGSCSTAENAEQDTESDADDEGPVSQHLSNNAGTTFPSYMQFDSGNESTSATASSDLTTSVPLNNMTTFRSDPESSISTSATQAMVSTRSSARNRRPSTIATDFKLKASQVSMHDTQRQGRSSYRSDTGNTRRSISSNPANGIPWYAILGQRRSGIPEESQLVPGQQTPTLRFTDSQYYQDTTNDAFLYESPTNTANEWHGRASPQGHPQQRPQTGIMMHSNQPVPHEKQPLGAPVDETARTDAHGGTVAEAVDPRLIYPQPVYAQPYQALPVIPIDYETAFNGSIPTYSAYMQYPLPNPQYSVTQPRSHTHPARTVVPHVSPTGIYHNSRYTDSHALTGYYRNSYS